MSVGKVFRFGGVEWTVYRIVAEAPADFRLLSEARDVAIVARGRGIRILDFLRNRYGGTNWRQLKGIATIKDFAGWTSDAEVHWFEAHGVGRVLWKIKRRLS